MRKRYICGPSALHLLGFSTPIRPGEVFEYAFTESIEAMHVSAGAVRLHDNQGGVQQPEPPAPIDRGAPASSEDMTAAAAQVTTDVAPEVAPEDETKPRRRGRGEK